MNQWLNAPVKTLGTFKTAIRLHPEVKIDVEFTVARSIEEANQKVQAADLLERAEDAAKLEAESAPALELKAPRHLAACHYAPKEALAA